jgi:hypothetical protein
MKTQRQRGGHGLFKPQYLHLKRTLLSMGPTFHHIEDVFTLHNQTAKKSSELLISPGQIFEYAFYKSLSALTQWSVADNQYVQYSKKLPVRSLVTQQPLTKAQSTHLKQTLLAMGPYLFPVQFVIKHHNRTATSEELLEFPQDILDYARHKAKNPKYVDWTVENDNISYTRRNQN